MKSPTALRIASDTSSAADAASAASDARLAASSGTVRMTHLMSGNAGGATLRRS